MRANGSANPPGSIRMVIIAFLSFNLSMGTMFGPFGLLIAPIEQQFHVSREISTLAVPIVTLVLSLLAPFVGNLAERFSLRRMMMASTLLMAAGFTLLAASHSVVQLLAAYALLIGPGLSVCGAVGPATLVTRWLRSGAGKALGVATTPALMAAMPLAISFVLMHSGLAAAYGLMALLMLACSAAVSFVVDFPATGGPGSLAEADETTAATAQAPANLSNVLRDTRFWRLAVGAGCYNAVIMMFATQLIPYAIGLGIDPMRAAMLMTVYFVGSLVGNPLVGWGADRLGGASTIAGLSLALAAWQGLLTLQPGYTMLALLSGLSGLQGTAMITCLSKALSEHFGVAQFARAYGASALVGLPFGVLAVPIASALFVYTGSYQTVFEVAAVLLAFAAALVFTVDKSGGQGQRTCT